MPKRDSKNPNQPLSNLLFLLVQVINWYIGSILHLFPYVTNSKKNNNNKKKERKKQTLTSQSSYPNQNPHQFNHSIFFIFITSSFNKPLINYSMSKLRQALNYLQILKEAIKLPLTNPTLILSITLFILLPFNLLQLFVAVAFDLPPSFELKGNQGNKTILQVELVRETLQWLTNTLAISMLSKAYIEKPSSMLELLHACTPKQWFKVFATSLLGEIITFSSSTLLLFIGHPLIDTNFKDANLARFVGVVVGFGVLMYVYLACELGVVVASVEGGCFGIGAIGKGVEMIRGRKVQSFVLMGLMFVVDELVGGGVRVGLQLFWFSLCCVLYLESRKRVGIEKDEDEEMWIV